MIYVWIHLAIGALLIGQSLIRHGFKRDLEEVLLCVGAVVLWPIVLAHELRQYVDAKRARAAEEAYVKTRKKEDNADG